MKIGDSVSVINEAISGVIIKLDGNTALIEDSHGFERPYQLSELVVTSTAKDYKIEDYQFEKDVEEKLKAQIVEHRLKSFEIDLHIEELIDDHSNMTNHEILTKQMTACKGFIQNALGRNMNKVVLIHGKGEGVLKSEIHSFLNKLRNYNGVNLEYHDASYSEYGMGGATEVLFH